MAGSGDMMDQMIYLAAERGIADRFHFPGFMRGKEVYECLKASDVYVMPSVSEPFGISPLEAMQCGTPSIISKQSGCAEILNNCIRLTIGIFMRSLMLSTPFVIMRVSSITLLKRVRKRLTR